MEKKINVTKETVTVTLKLEPWKSGQRKVRYYVDNAREWIKEAYPKIVIGSCRTPCVVKNQGPNYEGEWVFEIIQKEIKEPNTQETKKKISTKKEVARKTKEVSNVKNSNRTD